ncbi:NTP transferase domain-containing protein [bacterium]|nr:NTP transferase domain-containing protein [bacterium]MBU1025902.1 NTP transferase domain-containing protein [bacterium]
MTQNKLTGAILAAGRGSRLMPISENYPKPLLPICNKPIVQYQLEYMRDIGIEEVFLVVGHLKSSFERVFGTGEALGMNLVFLEQESQLGIAHAVYMLEKHLTTPFLLFLGDIFIVPTELDKMINLFFEKKAGAVLAVKHEKDPEAIKRNFSVTIDDRGQVSRVIEKPRYVKNDMKGCGIYLFDLPFFDSLRQTPRTAMRDEYEITDSIQIFINDGYPVYVAESVKEDINITFPEDLLLCNYLELKKRGKKNIIGENTNVPENCDVIDSVIGSNVQINDITRRIERCVIFDDSKTGNFVEIENSLITPQYHLHFDKLDLSVTS